MKDTAKRIRAYKAALPGLKERLAAVALLLVVSTVMMISATFAWITLSRAPEVTGINTTISGNGNLEIALSDKDGLEPDEFDVDESLTKEGVNVTLSNLEWGNLINLSDPSYGIDNLALRPAQLNTSNLLTSPLWGAVYAEDGRITALDSNYAYAKFDGKQFMTSNEYGVRAIASYTETISDATQLKYKEMKDAVQTANTNVNQTYETVIKNFDALGTMISKYAQDKLDKADPGTNLAPYLKDVLAVYEAVDSTMIAEKDALLALANFQAYMNANATGTTFSELTWDDIEKNAAQYNTDSVDKVSANGTVSLVNLKSFISDLKLLETDITYLKQYIANYNADNTPYYWSSGGEKNYNINNMISRLIDYGNMTIDLEDNGTEKKVSQLGTSDAMALLGANNKSRKAYVYNGILRRVEDNLIDEAYRMNGNAACKIEVTFGFTIKVNGKAYTKASGPSTFSQAFTKAQGTTLTAQDQVAEDTYGMAVDLWVRTNAESTCLTLEGATATDQNGNIIRYDGANRIWGRVPSTDTIYTTESTSQGGGSCYIYYADTPEDMARSLDLLDSMKVAFVSQAGSLLATAEMDTTNYCAVNGRITVPLVLDNNTKTTYTYVNEKNEERTGKAITTLTYDGAQRITAIIYLDGTRLTNDNVLAASEIQGQLNIQFGSSENLETIGSNELIDDQRTVTAEVSKKEIDFDAAKSDDDKTVDVKVTINGTTATDVQAFFVRAINSTQGSRETTMHFTQQNDGTWTASYLFTAPGNYTLRYIRVNGVDYALANPPEVTVSGFGLKNVTWGEATDSVVVRTSDGSYSEKVTVEFATTDRNKEPNTVQARFVRTDGNTVNIPLTRGTDNKWTGTGTFTTSGVYTLEYLVYTNNTSSNGIYQDVTQFKKTLDLSLGMYAEVKDLTGGLVMDYVAGDTYNKDVEVRIFDNVGNAVENLTGAQLYYSNGGSATNTICVDLTWTDAGSCYKATLPIVTAGRWMFGWVKLAGGQILTKASASPTYTIISPDPVSYVETSQTKYNTETQFVPLTNDAKIDGIAVRYASVAQVRAVVYNPAAAVDEKHNGYFVVEWGEKGVTASVGTDDITKFTIQLPTYYTEYDSDGNPVGGATQDGTWSVVALELTECYDANQTYHGADNPLIWLGNDDIAKAYGEKNYVNESGSTVAEIKDFSKLSTTVSGQLNVAFTQNGKDVSGQTIALGGSDVEFMHEFNVNELGMGVMLTDGNGNVIPFSKIQSVTLNVSYTAPGLKATNVYDTQYGYGVQPGANQNYDISFGNQDAESGMLEVVPKKENGGVDVWRYVGVYKVNSLTVTVDSGHSITLNSGSNGIPEAFTVYSKGPDLSDVKLEGLDGSSAISQGSPIYGKTGDNITGTFLQAYTLRTAVKPIIANGQAQYAVVDGLTFQLRLRYQDGKSAPNGGYTWTGTSYESITLDMENKGGTYTVKDPTPLLAGTYDVELVYTLGDTTKTVALDPISVYSQKPSLKVIGVTPGKDEVVQINTYDGDNPYLYGNAELINVQNYYTDTLANVYVAASKKTDTTSGWELVSYALPKVTVRMENVADKAGNVGFETASATITGNPNHLTFAANTLESTVSIGKIDEKDYVYAETWGGNRTSKYEVIEVLGECKVSTVTLVKDGITYTAKLQNELVIRESNSAPPSITFINPSTLGYTGYDDPTRYNQESVDGGSFEVVLPVTLGTTTEKYDVTDDSVEWVRNTELSMVENLMYYQAGTGTAKRVTDFSVGVYTWSHYDVTQPFTYYCYARETVVEEKTSTSQTFLGTYGIIKWKIGNQEYNPGEKVVIDGVVNAVPVIGQIGEGQAISQPTIKTIRRITRTETDPKVVPYTLQYAGEQYSNKWTGQENETAKNNSLNTAKGMYNDADVKKNAGVSSYGWFNPNNPTEYVKWGLPAYEEIEVQ